MIRVGGTIHPHSHPRRHRPDEAVLGPVVAGHQTVRTTGGRSHITQGRAIRAGAGELIPGRDENGRLRRGPLLITHTTRHLHNDPP